MMKALTMILTFCILFSLVPIQVPEAWGPIRKTFTPTMSIETSGDPDPTVLGLDLIEVVCHVDVQIRPRTVNLWSRGTATVFFIFPDTLDEAFVLDSLGRKKFLDLPIFDGSYAVADEFYQTYLAGRDLMAKIEKQKIASLLAEQFVIVTSGDDLPLVVGGATEFGEQGILIGFYDVDTIRIIKK
jgi:hypothetical protein